LVINMVMISHNVLLDELLNGSKLTTWRTRNNNPDQLWARVQQKLLKGDAVIATHYWKVRVAREKKSIHYIGKSQILKVAPRTVGTITADDAMLDGFTGIEYMRLALAESNGYHKSDYWQIFYDPEWT